MYKIAFLIFGIDLFLVVVFFIFQINLRTINIEDRKKRRMVVKLRYAALNHNSSALAAKKLHITVDEFNRLCSEHAIETPEERQKRLASKLNEEELTGDAQEWTERIHETVTAE